MIDRLAKQQSCQLFIEQEIEKGLKDGKTKYAIGHEIAAWIKKLFEADVNPHTIETRAHFIEQKQNEILRNRSTDSTPQDQSEIEENQYEPAKDKEEELDGRSGKTKVETMQDSMPPQSESKVSKMSKNIKRESEILFRLKFSWRRATKTDRQEFIKWLKKEGHEV